MRKNKRKVAMGVLLAGSLLTACTTGGTSTTGTGATGTTAEGTQSETKAGEATRPEGTQTGVGTKLLPPVESNDPNTDFEPAWAGQTRAPGLQTEAAFTVTVMAEGLNEPWAIAVLPDGRFAVTQKSGDMVLVSGDGTVSRPVTGFPAVESSSQGGLLDILPAPDFQNSRRLYFTLSELTDEGALTALGQGRLSEDESEIEDFTIMYRAIPYYGGSNHYGSRLDFDQEGNLIMTTGDRQSRETRDMAQGLDNGLGKILRITTEGQPAEGNPFLDDAEALPEIYSYGHRNVQGVAVHPETGEIWISEMGPQGGDELNHIKAGLNYGWPVISYGEEYGGAPIGDRIAVMDGMEQPRYYWDPVVAPAGMVFYEGDVIPEWENSLFIAALRGQHILRLVLDDQDVIGEERLLVDERERFRDITEGADGALYAITDSGLLYRVGP